MCEEGKKIKENNPRDVSTPKQKDKNLPSSAFSKRMLSPPDNNISVPRKIFSPPPQHNQTPIINEDNMDKLLDEEEEEGLEDISKDDFTEENCKEARNQSFLERGRADPSKF